MLVAGGRTMTNPLDLETIEQAARKHLRGAASQIKRLRDVIRGPEEWDYETEEIDALEAEVWFWRRLAGKTLSATVYCPNCDYELEADPKRLFDLTASTDGACGMCFERLVIRLGIKGVSNVIVELMPEPARI
jgi:hypothetical protein